MSVCCAVHPDGWLCMLNAHDIGDHLSWDNRELFGGSPGKPIRWPSKRGKPLTEPVAMKMPSPTSLGPPDAGNWTGEQCPDCHGMRMQRQGYCSKCVDCGSTTGCS